MTIPVENVFRLLYYAWEELQETDLAEVGTDGVTSLPDLFGRVLASGCRRMLRTGFDRGYRLVDMEVSGIRGRLDFPRTIKRSLLPLGRTACRVPQFGPDVLHNRIVKATAKRLLTSAELNDSIRLELQQVVDRLSPAKPVSLRPSVFRGVQLHRSAAAYRLLMDICRCVCESTVVHEQSGDLLFRDFARPHQAMARLFEAFLLNFYRREQDTYRVARESFRWRRVSGSPESLALLPGMRTDVTLSKADARIIIDAKYYQDVLRLRHGSRRLREGHLYQMYAYLQNRAAFDEKKRSSAGVLLYAESGESVSAGYNIYGHRLLIRTLNLGQPWEDIRATLLGLPDEVWMNTEDQRPMQVES